MAKSVVPFDRGRQSSDSKDVPMHLEPIACFVRRMNMAPFVPWVWRLGPRLRGRCPFVPPFTPFTSAQAVVLLFGWFFRNMTRFTRTLVAVGLS